MDKEFSEFFIILVALFSIIILLVLGLWWLVHDHQSNLHRFSWHRLLKNSFHLSYVDEAGFNWVIDIHYNSDKTEPSYKVVGDRKLQLTIPMTLSKQDFIDFISHISGLDSRIDSIIKGITSDSDLSGAHFTKEDHTIYRDFRRQLLLKALRG